MEHISESEYAHPLHPRLIDPNSTRRLHVAMWTPLPPAPSGISDYAVALSRALIPHVDLTIYSAADADLSLFTGLPITVLSYQDYNPISNRQADVHIYHMGNSAHFHTEIYRQLLREPGIVVLHDLALFGFYLFNLYHQGSRQQFLEELAYHHGSRAAKGAGRYISSDFSSWLDLPMNRRVVEASLATIVHSRYGQESLLAKYPQAAVYSVQHGAHVLDGGSRMGVRRTYGWQDNQFVVGVFGEISPHKRIHVLLEALPRLLMVNPESGLLLAGRDGPNPNYPTKIRNMLRDRKIRNSVSYVPNPSTPQLEQFIQAVDVVVNLRWPTTGEMSGIMLRAFGAGKPVIGSDVPQWRELPESFCWRVPVGDGEVSALVERLTYAAEHPTETRRAGDAARRFVIDHATWEIAASRYLAVIESVVAQKRG